MLPPSVVADLQSTSQHSSVVSVFDYEAKEVPKMKKPVAERKG